ncbi:MAG: phenylalanine--tRNA ligase subunit alpha [Chloroflexi bacterium]|nr:phenylalanine--tRNA ligase subunit alpha [Chloroflexota bacterium]
MQEQLTHLRAEALAALEKVSNAKELEEWRIAYLGRKGQMTQVLRGLGALSPEDRRAAGAQSNELKALLEQRFAEREAALQAGSAEAIAASEAIDVTLPGRPVQIGRLHPITQVIREITGAFTAMGFQVVEGPEVEWDYYNFETLNIPKGHPARDMWDTMWIDQKNKDGERPLLLRTHTSPMQIRYMERHKPPVRVVVPGKVYRYEATDATHEWHFHQIEGLVVDKGVSFAQLKGTLEEFAKRLFGIERKVRFRCDYFPFVEPGAEMAIDWQGRWLEILGAGMVHPVVLKNMGCDPQVYSGFAFGMGVERIAMLKYGIDDIRHFYTNDLRFLKQF